MHELAGVAGLAGLEVLVQDQDLGAGDRLADRVGLPVDPVGREEGAPEGLGEAVHEHQVSMWLAATQLADRVDGQAPPGIGHDPQRVEPVARERVDTE